VTNARGGYSNHNFGIAWDIGIFDGNEYLDESSLYDRAGEIGRSMGLEWGGDWHGITDKPHFQCKVNMTLAQLRSLHSAGKPVPIPPFSDPNEVTVLLNGEETDIPALLVSGRTFVGAKGFVAALGGELVSAGGSPFVVVIKNDGVERPFQGRIIDGTGFIRFADLNGIYNLDYIFDSKKQQLSLSS
jgi:hypothetical protein